MKRPILGITMGDAAGIGPELILKALAVQDVYDKCAPLLIGSADVMAFYKERFGSSLDTRIVTDVQDGKFEYGTMDILDVGGIDASQVEIGRVSPIVGKAAVVYTQEAGRLAMDGRIDAVVSAPLNKEAMYAAGYSFEGQTQILAELTGAKRYGMILILGDMRVMMLTTHMALRKACDAISKERVLSMIELAHQTLTTFGIRNPCIGVAGLNPHAGEGGTFGTEEINHIVPAINVAIERGINAIGPVPADVIFVKAQKGAYDIVLALYHDQANMAAKLLGFGSVVTMLAGLPIIRTSVGHGTAFDIAGKNVADPRNFIEAIRVAADACGVCSN